MYFYEVNHATQFPSVFQYHQNAEFLWRLAKATRNMSCIEEKHGNLEGKKSYIFEGNLVCLMFSVLLTVLFVCLWLITDGLCLCSLQLCGSGLGAG